jgi:DivIVA domain-containing protein
MPKRHNRSEQTSPVAATGEAKRITPVDIQQREFRLAFRGYHEGEVDQFLDELTEEVARLYAENKRLREEVDFKRTERFDTHATGDVDALMRQAREEAARIVDEARASALAAPGSTQLSSLQPATVQAATALLGPFLAREREFLQSLAALIQGHADDVKEGIRRAKEEMTTAARAESTKEADEVVQPVGVAPVEDRAEEVIEKTDDRESAEEEPVDDAPSPDQEGGEDTSSWRSGDRIMDLTENNVEVDRPAPQRVAADDRDDRSIREFFWGED